MSSGSQSLHMLDWFSFLAGGADEAPAVGGSGLGGRKHAVDSALVCERRPRWPVSPADGGERQQRCAVSLPQ